VIPAPSSNTLKGWGETFRGYSGQGPEISLGSALDPRKGAPFRNHDLRDGRSAPGERTPTHRPIPKNSSFGRSSATLAIRFDRAKSAVMEAMSQMSSGLNPCAANVA
jgi:hypothetical protein